MADTNRRPLKSRSSGWARKAASLLAGTNISPNQISLISIVFAAIGAALLLRYPGALGLLGCALCIQGRLACNLLDGMVAIEGGKQSPLGQLYNEFPDRIADCILIVALGYAAHLPTIGWLGALAAALTAYVRVFGGALGLAQDFRGPLAKPHRMAAMTGCLFAAIEQPAAGTEYALTLTAYVIAIGAIATCVTRTAAIARQLRS